MNLMQIAFRWLLRRIFLRSSAEFYTKMMDSNIQDKPSIYHELEVKCKKMGFSMPSDVHVGSLLRTLTASKPQANILELGTGASLSLSWMVDGMDPGAKLVTLDNDPELSKIAEEYFGEDERVQIICQDAADWIKGYNGEKFDLIFADAWPGKYSQIEEILGLLRMGGLYVIDDMLPQSNWPEGHEKKAKELIQYLEEREDLTLTKINWSTGIVIAAKKY